MKSPVARTQLQRLLQKLVSLRGTDLFIHVDAPPYVKVQGNLKPLDSKILRSEQVSRMVHSIMEEADWNRFQLEHEFNGGYTDDQQRRFRISAYRQKDQPAMVIRYIHSHIPTLQELGLPEALGALCLEKQGLILVVGPTDSGKSHTLAAMVHRRSTQKDGHIICIEEPLEFIHGNEKSLVSQREVGVDCASYSVALQNALRQSPDMLVIGEVRTEETMRYAMQYAQTGHLCLSTLHANNAYQALDRIRHFWPEDRAEQLFLELSLNLKVIVAQRLIPTAHGDSRVLAVELLLNTPLVAEHIRRGEINLLKEDMRKQQESGMQTFETSLYGLIRAGHIDATDGLKYADQVNDLRLQLKLDADGDDERFEGGLSSLSLESK
ncbi:MAG TPA: type IV pili twitching motility protein PilT [Gammaproteobacteria bacterium]|nr:type IV pili twitching motility protein PilT [Gammaproteobacteria bacterium]